MERHAKDPAAESRPTFELEGWLCSSRSERYDNAIVSSFLRASHGSPRHFMSAKCVPVRHVFLRWVHHPSHVRPEGSPVLVETRLMNFWGALNKILWSCQRDYPQFYSTLETYTRQIGPPPQQGDVAVRAAQLEGRHD